MIVSAIFYGIRNPQDQPARRLLHVVKKPKAGGR